MDDSLDVTSPFAQNYFANNWHIYQIFFKLGINVYAGNVLKSEPHFGRMFIIPHLTATVVCFWKNVAKGLTFSINDHFYKNTFFSITGKIFL